MRTMIKPLLGALLAVLALSAVASASASAATCAAEHHTLCVEGKQVGSASKPAIVPFTFKQKAGADPVFQNTEEGWTMTCTSVKAGESPAIESAGEGSAKLTPFQFRMEGCEAQQGKEESKCRIEEVDTDPLKGTFGSSVENLTLASTRTNNEFMEIQITGCSENGDWWVYGSEECSLKQAEVETTTKELVCEAKKSKLELKHGEGGPANFGPLEGTIELSGESKGKKFSIKS